MGVLPTVKRYTKVVPSLEVTRVIYSDPASAQVVVPSLEVTRYSYRSPSIPIDPKVSLFTVILPLPRWCAPASKLPGIPIDPQVFP